MKPFVRFGYQPSSIYWEIGVGLADQRTPYHLAQYRFLASFKLGRRTLWIDIWPKKVGT